MATIVTAVSAFKHIAVYDIAFDAADAAVIKHSLGSAVLKVTIVPTGAVGSFALPAVVFDNDNQMTLSTTLDADGTFRVFIEPTPILGAN